MRRIADAVGRVVGGRYRLLAPIGSGASATVYVAEDTTLHRRVAVKVLHTALTEDEGFLRRFRAEARVAASLTHTNLVRVYDWGEDDDGPFLVLELLEGGSLRGLLDSGVRLTPEQAAAVGAQAARGLEHAHRRGLVHRDIKPANLLFDAEGRVCIADFGLARALAEAAITEPGGAMLGTARYAAPEQVRGNDVDARADVYALSLVLVEAVTGHVPFTADTTIGTLMARLDNDVYVPHELGALREPLARAGAGDPDARVDAGELARAFERAAAAMPPPAPLPLVTDSVAAPAPAPTAVDLTEMGAAVPAARAARDRRRWPLAAAAAVVAVLVAIAGGMLIAEAMVPSHPVPDVLGKSLEEARQVAAARKLKVEVVERRYQDGSAVGEVLDQDPARGSLKENRPLELTVSRGPPPVGIPDIAGMTVDAAAAALAEVGLELDRDAITLEPSETIPEGQVMTWAGREPDGDPGQAPKGSTVAVTVSDGPPRLIVPDVRDAEDPDAAEQQLRGHGFRVKTEEVFSDDVEAGRIVGTSPAAGQEARKGSVVTLRISKGPELIAVPDVEGKKIDEARRILERAGLKVGRIIGHNRATEVAFTDPEAGSRVKRGSEVTLYVRRDD